MKQQWVQKQNMVQKDKDGFQKVLGGSVPIITNPRNVATDSSFAAVDDVDNEDNRETEVEKVKNEVYHDGEGEPPTMDG